MKLLLDLDTSFIILSFSANLQSVPLPINIIDTVGVSGNIELQNKNRYRYSFTPTVLEQNDLMHNITQLSYVLKE